MLHAAADLIEIVNRFGSPNILVVGDLILDEFAFHENSNAIWEAAEPILAANREFLCRIASTGNGRHNLFYRMAGGTGPDDGTFFQSAADYTVSRAR